MYTFVTATCLPRSIGPQWEVKPHLDQVVVYQIYSTYKKTYLTLNHPDIEGEVYVDFDTLKNDYASYNGTLAQLLVLLDDTTLQTVDSIPVQDIAYAKYNDAVRAGYKANLAVIGVVLPENYPDDDKPDLAITRPAIETDLNLLHTFTMLSVNGYYHMTEPGVDVVYVKDGGITMRRSNENHLGVWDFTNVGSLKKVPIDPSKILPSVIDTDLKDKLIFTVEEDFTNKSYFLVLGGYLVFPQENVFWLSGDNTFTFDINQIPYIPRLYESKREIDLSSLGLTTVAINPEHGYSIENAFSDEVIKAYFSLSQSYMVVVDTPYLSTVKIPVISERTPGKFTSYQDPSYPLMVGYGKVAEYWKKEDEGFWSVDITGGRWDQFVSSAKPYTDQHIVTDQCLSYRPYYPSEGFLLQVAGYPET